MNKVKFDFMESLRLEASQCNSQTSRSCPSAFAAPTASWTHLIELPRLEGERLVGSRCLGDRKSGPNSAASAFVNLNLNATQRIARLPRLLGMDSSMLAI
jgi:hypothetical protein